MDLEKRRPARPRRRLNVTFFAQLVTLAVSVVLGYIALNVAVDYYGPSDYHCTGTGKNRNCSDPNETGAQLQALFTGSADHATVDQGWLWIARICALVVAAWFVALTGRWLWEKADLARRKRRMGMR